MCLFLRRWWRQWRRQRWRRRDEDDDYNDDDIFFRFIPSVDVVLLMAAVLCTLGAKCTLELSGFQRENQEFLRTSPMLQRRSLIIPRNIEVCAVGGTLFPMIAPVLTQSGNEKYWMHIFNELMTNLSKVIIFAQQHKRNDKGICYLTLVYGDSPNFLCSLSLSPSNNSFSIEVFFCICTYICRLKCAKKISFWQFIGIHDKVNQSAE